MGADSSEETIGDDQQGFALSMKEAAWMRQSLLWIGQQIGGTLVGSKCALVRVTAWQEVNL